MLLAIYPAFNRVTPTNLLYAAVGAFYHDFGKLLEYNTEGAYNYEYLCMLGHPYISASNLEKHIREEFQKWSKEIVISDEIKQQINIETVKIIHIVLSHHAIAGHADWGSPVLPHSPEAFLVCHLDNLSGDGDKFNHPAPNEHIFTALD